ncbi:hypothetical protein EMIHUDRAFT_205126, partial [Emiliania huxleyi CCMP1516]
ELLAEVEAEKRGKGKKGKKKKKAGGSGGAGPSQESEAPAEEAAAAKPAKLDREGLIRLLETLHEERIRQGEARLGGRCEGEGAGGSLAREDQEVCCVLARTGNGQCQWREGYGSLFCVLAIPMRNCTGGRYCYWGSGLW